MRQKQLPDILKGEIDQEQGFKCSIWRYRPKPGEPGKGGIRIYLKSRDFERIFDGCSVLSVGSGTRFISPPKIYDYRSSIEANSIINNLQSYPGKNGLNYSPDWRTSGPILSGENGSFNVCFLRAVGLGAGVTWQVDGVFTRSSLETYLELLKQYVRHVYAQLVDSVRLDLNVARPDREERVNGHEIR